MADSDEEHANIKRHVSFVWRYFDKLQRDRVKCRLCRHEQNYHGTGNLFRHLSKKHNIYVTVRVNNNNKRNNECLQLENEFTKLIDEKPPSNSHQEQQRSLRETKVKMAKIALDPYQDNEFPGEGYIQLDEINFKNQAPLTAEEDSLVSQIDYFREKVAYYRMQKNLVVLQAAKIKRELQQLRT